MTPEIALALGLLVVAVVLLVTEWIPMEVTALLALGAAALTGLVGPAEALSGFSNPAVVTVWAVFILSGGLTRTGVASVIGSFVLRLSGRGEATLVAVIMTTAGLLSAVMNNVAVAALMLPVVMDIARHTGRAPSHLLMPLAYGSLLGGLTTLIGTPPNILVSDALRSAGFTPFTFFDFTPAGLVVMAAGVAFMTLVGRHLLPHRDVAQVASARPGIDWQTPEDAEGLPFEVRIPTGSALAGKTLADVRLGLVLGWNVVRIVRAGRVLLAPGPRDVLAAGDRLTIEGRHENLDDLRCWRELVEDEDGIDVERLWADEVRVGEVEIPDPSRFAGSTLRLLGFRDRFGVNVLAVRRGEYVRRTGLQDEPLLRGDVLLLAGPQERLEALGGTSGFAGFHTLERSELRDVYHLQDRLLVLRVPADSSLAGKSLAESRLGETLSGRVLGILRGAQPPVLPEPGEVLQGDDRLLVEASRADLEVLGGIEALEVGSPSGTDVQTLVSDEVGLVEAILAPQTTLAGKTLRQINFREKYGLNVVALWRGGRALRGGLRNVALHFGDAMLVLGPRERLRMLGREPDFIVLTETAQEEIRRDKMRWSVAILALILTPVVVGWVPISIAAVVGAALMVLTGCLTMEEAYRHIEWKAVFLIAGMLPLGAALDQTGAARLIAEGVVALVGPLGPRAVLLGLVVLTFLATCFVPTAALVVLMAPIVLSTAADLGLSPHGLLMGVALAASASFTTPIAHPANLLVMGPGGYRFADYVKVGGALTLVILVVVVAVLPLFWPLGP